MQRQFDNVLLPCKSSRQSMPSDTSPFSSYSSVCWRCLFNNRLTVATSSWFNNYPINELLMVEGLSKTENCTVYTSTSCTGFWHPIKWNSTVHTYEYTVGLLVPLVYILISYDLLKVSLVRSTDHWNFEIWIQGPKDPRFLVAYLASSRSKRCTSIRVYPSDIRTFT